MVEWFVPADPPARQANGMTGLSRKNLNPCLNRRATKGMAGEPLRESIYGQDHPSRKASRPDKFLPGSLKESNRKRKEKMVDRKVEQCFKKIAQFARQNRHSREGVPWREKRGLAITDTKILLVYFGDHTGKKFSDTPKPPSWVRIFRNHADAEGMTAYKFQPPKDIKRVAPTKKCVECEGMGHIRKCWLCKGSRRHYCLCCHMNHACKECEGAGFEPVDKFADRSEPCSHCNGTGRVDEYNPVKICSTGHFIQTKYARIMIALGVKRIWLQPDQLLNPILFEFKNGKGMVMPFNYQEATK